MSLPTLFAAPTVSAENSLFQRLALLTPLADTVCGLNGVRRKRVASTACAADTVDTVVFSRARAGAYMRGRARTRVKNSMVSTVSMVSAKAAAPVPSEGRSPHPNQAALGQGRGETKG